MVHNNNIVRSASIGDIRFGSYESGQIPIFPATLIHQYVRLDMDHDVEFAETKVAALDYLRAVAEAASIVHYIASDPEFDGLVLEPQGSTIHAAVPLSGHYTETAIAFAASVHQLFLRRIQPFHSCVNGWRITIDAGNTLVIAGRGVHGDQSLVSIGNAANRPAKHLYQQLSISNENDRNLKCYMLGIRDPETDQWQHIDLNGMQRHQTAIRLDKDVIETINYRVQLVKPPQSRSTPITAQAHPIAPTGNPDSPTAEQPEQHHGWIMRADLDGFTAQVEACMDDVARMDDMARQFAQLMDTAASFVETHKEIMVQLPWAGDNFTAAVVFGNKQHYDDARVSRLIEHALDFDDETGREAGDTRWAYGVCGGKVHGNSGGNVYIGSVEIGGMRFLIGAGAGFARSLQAFADIKPASGKIEILADDDYIVLHDSYKRHFGSVRRADRAISSLFKESTIESLKHAYDSTATANRSVTIQAAPSATASLVVKPYATRDKKNIHRSM